MRPAPDFPNPAGRVQGVIPSIGVRLQVTKGQKGDDVLPVVWEDNYITLLPGETREIRATYKIKDLGSERAAVTVTGWNVK